MRFLKYYGFAEWCSNVFKVWWDDHFVRSFVLNIAVKDFDWIRLDILTKMQKKCITRARLVTGE